MSSREKKNVFQKVLQGHVPLSRQASLPTPDFFNKNVQAKNPVTVLPTMGAQHEGILTPITRVNKHSQKVEQNRGTITGSWWGTLFEPFLH